MDARVIWRNETPEYIMYSKSVTLTNSVSEFDLIMIVFRANNTIDQQDTCILHGTKAIISTAYGGMMWRTADFSGASCYFGDGYVGETQNAGAVIPVEIIGVNF